MKKLAKTLNITLLFNMLFLVQSVFSQAEQVADSLKTDSVETEIAPPPISFNVVESIAIYPGCETLETNGERKKCMSKKISQFVGQHFNTDLGAELGLIGKQRIFVFFVIDKNGKVTDITARTRYPELATEAKRVVAKLPKFTPATQRGKNVSIKYSLPIAFIIED